MQQIALNSEFATQQCMLRATFYQIRIKFYTDDIRASVTNPMFCKNTFEYVSTENNHAKR